MDLGLTGRAAFVAAASKGLGRASALALAAEGCAVAICARGEDALRAAEREIAATGARAHAIVADVSDAAAARDAVEEAAATFGRLDVLVTNAGGPPPGGFDAFDEDDYRRAVELNMLSAIAMARAAVPHMRRGGWGRIVNIVSIAAKQPIDGLILSNTARAGLLGFAKTVATELAPHGITVNSVLPGTILTDRIRSFAEAAVAAEGITIDEAVDRMAKAIPAKRIGRAEEFGALVAFLASEHAGYLTGAAIQIDGGASRGLL